MARSPSRRLGARVAGDDEDATPDRVDIHVGARIRMRRIWLDMNQQALARKLGLTFQQIQKYENGTNRVSASRLAEIATALGVTVGYFYDELREDGALSPEEALWEQRIAQSEALDLVRYYYAIPDSRVREHFLALIKAAAAAARTD